MVIMSRPAPQIALLRTTVGQLVQEITDTLLGKPIL